ncbi:MAG TPA: tRNA (N6-threonylcarbamoyladenosine(37)-N6)-methyltransferase TrmO [Actinomycetota bacterium]|nr:tRNA (N6-threonylcarbamoyladenosine(37)-N6)-methyltransferase TrmO [Actinomycetota bacterium]
MQLKRVRRVAVTLTLRPIGWVRHDHPDGVLKEQWHSLTSVIDIEPELQDGLTGIDGFSHLFVLFWMSRLSDDARNTLEIKPRGLVRMGLSLDELPTIGVFASDAPPRPNPIGLTVVELVDRDGARLTVRGLDAFSDTPVIDIKPYTKDRAVDGFVEAGWHEELIRRTGARRV